MVCARGEQSRNCLQAVNLIAAAPVWLVWILVGAIAAAAIEDSIRLRISNVTCAIVAGAAVAAMLATGPSLALWQNFTLFAIIMVLGTAAFAAGLFGGGDVKLLAAIGLWLDLRGGLFLLAAVLLAGGMVAIAYLAASLVRRSNLRAARTRRVPYGIAIALGTLIAVSVARVQPALNSPSAELGHR